MLFKLKNFSTAFVAVLLLIVISNFTAAQEKKPDAQKSGTTVDAWRQALPPEAEIENQLNENATENRARTSPEQLKRDLLVQEDRWMQALKLRDTSTLTQVLADDFSLIDARLPNVSLEKTAYLDFALHDLKLAAYEFIKPTVRLYGKTAIVSSRLKQESSFKGIDSSGAQFVTDVWIYNDGFWRAVSRHVSSLQ